MPTTLPKPPQHLHLLTITTIFIILTPSLLSFPTSTSKLELRTFIIGVDHHAKPTIFPTHQHWYQSTLNSLISTSAVTSKPILIHTYTTVFHGFAAHLTNSHARELTCLPHVLALIPQQVRKPHTTRSPQFLGLNVSSQVVGSLLSESDFGSDLVIGVIDTGIWPERPSFNDRGLGPVPTKWKGKCHGISCNNKIIGARYFSSGYEVINGRVNVTCEFRSPRDSDGHGTHTSSIAAGRYVFPASMQGYARGMAAGMAPKARLAVYKVCWKMGCFDSDILKAFDTAVSDGVDVVSFSVGGAVVPYYLDPIAIAAFGATELGVLVSASAGNGGPGELSVTNVAPWITTVGAGSIDRDFPSEIVLGNGVVVPGVSLYSGPGLRPGKMYPIYYGGGVRGEGGGGYGYSSSLCLDRSLDDKLVRGKIVVCDRGVNSRVEKGVVVKNAGGVAMIVANNVFDGDGLVADSHILPATAVGSAHGDVIRRYVARVADPTGRIVFRGTRVGVRPAPVVAAFSARGPNPQSPEVIKPDVIAPGLNILASWTGRVGPSGLESDRRRTDYNIISGTSMACPHVSGLAALLKAAHPDWSPAAIRSALMTTAYTVDNEGKTMRDESTGNVSTVFDFGSGHVHPQKAMDPGLIYDISHYDYIDFLCNSNYSVDDIEVITRKKADCSGAKRAGHVGNLNYPSMSVVFQQYGKHKMSSHLIRTVTNVGEQNSVYKVKVHPPVGTLVTVEPEQLVFRRVGQKLNYLVRVQVREAKLEPGFARTRTGSVTWFDGKRTVTSPLAVTIQQPI